MFESHKLNQDGLDQIANFKSVLNNAANFAIKRMPDGRDRALFVTELEKAVFFGTRAIASKPGNYTEIQKFDKPIKTEEPKAEAPKTEKTPEETFKPITK